MIHAVLVFNNDGKPRLSKFYSQSSSSPALTSKERRTKEECCLITSSSPSNLKYEFLKTIYNLTNHHQNTKLSSASSSSSSKTNFINLDQSVLSLLNKNFFHHQKHLLPNNTRHPSPPNLDFFQLHPDYLNLELCLVYRNYATLFFVFLIDQSESQLGILDLIQVFVESLDKCFKNVCELDLIFNYDKLDLLLNQIILGGIVLDTSVESIISNFQSQLKILKQSSSVSSFSTSL
ncbi:hypothetical protein PGT21_050370 [Puccinia graminis f. sp. tritici]|uniref:Sigma-adaptin 3A n=1 Tax=Puccinia graminis f. sp. tritici TaxID=56615 RepID=A0A5B0N1H4_PUCGR|nr:Sigma-adaptin 3A, variant 2 [Puccinia graminis f. sp. tritici]KAA1081949.1 Sigma-adaptin 3A [Puccinia graminis f. sp. tritici]KAA1085014.1 hypothetical protein PGT21_050370 [Puccinia graminis f. sp. tritici]